MKPERRLVIDIGTNSVLALLVDLSSGGMEVVSDKQMTTRLGQDLSKTGRLSDIAMNRTAQAIESFVEGAEFDSAFLIGTEALRAAANSTEFIDLVEKKTGHRPLIISGRQEAEFTFRGAIPGLDLNSENIVVVDVGGGSTEIISGKDDQITEMQSIPLGALRLREAVAVERLSAYRDFAHDFMIDRRLLDSRLPAEIVIGVGGTITSMAALAQGLEAFNPEAVHGYRMSMDNLESVAARFEKAGDEGRPKLIRFDPQRADLILPGTGIFLAVMGIIGVTELTVSTGGLRFGVALSPDNLL
jgi:exopolyphosphatase/guanosine-5'-triphosphate,3'-diphosphate pyrophosphatase